MIELSDNSSNRKRPIYLLSLGRKNNSHSVGCANNWSRYFCVCSYSLSIFWMDWFKIWFLAIQWTKNWIKPVFRVHFFWIWVVSWPFGFFCITCVKLAYFINQFPSMMVFADRWKCHHPFRTALSWSSYHRSWERSTIQQFNSWWMMQTCWSTHKYYRRFVRTAHRVPTTTTPTVATGMQTRKEGKKRYVFAVAVTVYVNSILKDHSMRKLISLIKMYTKLRFMNFFRSNHRLLNMLTRCIWFFFLFQSLFPISFFLLIEYISMIFTVRFDLGFRHLRDCTEESNTKTKCMK